jgi:transcriptional regulator with XRE-family HTH domain
MMDEARWFEELEREYADDPEYILYGLLYVITDDICRAMEEQGITRATLADRLGVSRQYITKFLNTPANTTLESIVRFANAVGLAVDVSLIPKARQGVTPTDWGPQEQSWPVSAFGEARPTRLLPSSFEGGEETDEPREVAA